MSATTFSPHNASRVMPEEIDPADAAARDNRAPETGEVTTRQDYVDLLGGTLRFGSGNPSNPCGIPGYGDIYTGTYTNYRLIRRHPTVAHVRRQVFAPVTYNAFGWGATKDAPAGAKDLMQRMFTPRKIRHVKSHACLSLDYGCLGGEIVWEFKEGTYWYDRFKPLVIDTTGVMVVRGTGRFAGLRWGAGDAYLERRKCALFTYGQAQGGEAGFLYGESRLENIRETSWFDWINAAQQLMWITQKLAGKLCVITSPGGTYVIGKDEATGKDITRSYRDAAMSAGKAIADPRSNGVVWMPTAALPGNITAANMDLMKYPMVQVEVIDFGSHSDAIEGTLSRMKYHDGRMSAGYLRSARTNQESEHGSRADSVEQTNTDTIDLEGVDSDIWDAINEQMVDAALELKYGPDARGTVFGIPAKMTDENRTFDDKLIDAVLLDDELRVDILTGDKGKAVEAILKRRGWPGESPIVLEPYDPGAGDASPNDPDPNDPNAPKPADPRKEKVGA